MRFGVNFFPTDTTLQPVEFARYCEELGFESIWYAEHSHIPTSRATPWGGRQGAPPLPEKYWRTHDTLIALAAGAVATSRIRLGTGITLVAQRDPIWTAKEVASIDVLSGGRFEFGIGYGWNKEEIASHGVDFSERRALLREKVLMMKSLWTDEVASFDGEFLHLDPSWSWPKPVQKPHPRIHLGGGLGPKTMADIVEFCDGWMPLGRHELEGKVDELRRALDDAGRDVEAFEFGYFAGKPDPAHVEWLAGIGFTRILFPVESGSPEQVRDDLGVLAAFAAEWTA